MQWLGQQLPILPAIDKNDQLERGTWEPLFYKDDCPDCRQKLQQIFKTISPQQRPSRMLVEIPPYVVASRQADLQSAGWQYAQLTDQRKWFFPAPTSIVLQDGRVVKVNDQEVPPETNRPEVAKTVSILATDSPSGDSDEVFTQPVPHNLGYVKHGESREFAVRIHNPLQRDLVIRRVESECVCTQIIQPPEIIPAGQTIDIPMRFDSLQEPQVYSKDIALFTTDSRVPLIHITIQARIGLPLRVEPPKAANSDSGEYIAQIHNDSEVPVRLLYGTAATTGAYAKVPRNPILPRGYIELPIIVAATGQPAGAADAYIQIHTDSSEQPVLSVRIPQK